MHAPRKLQRKCACEGACDSCSSKKKLQRRARGRGPETIPPEVDAALAGSGSPLDAPTRSLMESRFQHDFGSVRVHTSDLASRSADRVAARAYTVGRDIVFAGGAYTPGTDAGRRLLAHELTHVVQQQSGAGLQMSSDISSPSDAGELEADRAADTVMNGGTPRIAASPSATLHRAVKVQSCTTPNAGACVVHLHPEEHNAYLAAQQIQREYCVNFVSLGAPGNRTIKVPGVPCDVNANRIFTDDKAILRCHAVPGCKVKDAELDKLIAWRDNHLTPALQACGGGSSPGWNATRPVVAMHNNTPASLDVDTYTPVTPPAPPAGAPAPAPATPAWSCEKDDKKVAHLSTDPATPPSKLTKATAPVPGREDPDNFVLVTQSKDFTGLKPRFNTILQSPRVGAGKDPSFDASLSAAMGASATTQYINIEAETKPFQAARYAFNLEMARDVMDYLKIPKRATPEKDACTGTGVTRTACPAPAAAPSPAPGPSPAPAPTPAPAPAPAPAAATPARTRPDNMPADCAFYSSTSMLNDAKDEWLRRIESVALDAAGAVKATAAQWIIGQIKSKKKGKSPKLIGLDPGAEAEAQKKCMTDTMLATQSAGGGTPPLKLASPLEKRTYRSYTEQRTLWRGKWKFKGDKFDRITDEAIKFNANPDCAALTLNAQWDPKDPTHKKCWAALDDETRARQIMQASAAPGLSRHHWGTDFDFAELNAPPWGAGGDWFDEAEWLKANAKFFGFIQSFEKDPAAGESRYMAEPWHWSYWPVAQALVDFTLAHTTEIRKALVGAWKKEGKVPAGKEVPSRFQYALDHWEDFVRNVTQATPTF